MDADELAELQRGLAQTWNVTTQRADQWSDLLEALTARVAHLLEHEYPRLESAMYTLDVAEARFNEAQQSADAPREIAKLILEREQQKAASRLAYERSRRNPPRISMDEHG